MPTYAHLQNRYMYLNSCKYHDTNFETRHLSTYPENEGTKLWSQISYRIPTQPFFFSTSVNSSWERRNLQETKYLEIEKSGYKAQVSLHIGRYLYG